MKGPPPEEDAQEELRRYRESVTEQVAHLIGVLQAVSVGDLRVEARRERDDELGMLAVGLNMMIDDIAELVETEKALRAEVARKVEELEATNAALREAQSQLVQTEKMASLGQLVAGVAHELNNPIGVIYANVRLIDGLVERIASGQGDPHQHRSQVARLLARSQEAATRTRDLVQQLRTFSRLDEAECKSVDLHDAIDATLQLLSLREREGVRFQREYGELPLVECYAGQLNQVFMNLLMNACDALAPKGGGRVVVRTALLPAGEVPGWPGGDRDAPIVVVSVEDEGTGIPAPCLDRIFDPFFTTKAVGKGMGLGLSISYQVVDRHGGRIRVESQEGRGSTFHVEFPLRRPQAG